MKIIGLFTQYSVLNTPFTYYYDGENISVGVRVLINFNGREIIGYVVSVEHTDETIEQCSNRLGLSLKKIDKVLDNTALLTPELLELSDNVTNYYLTKKISVLNAILPPSLKPALSSLRAPKIAMEKIIRFNPEFIDFESLKPNDNAFLNEVIVKGKLLYRSPLKAKVERLLQKNAISIEYIEKYRTKYDLYSVQKEYELTPAQQDAITTILNDHHESFLLHGVTGSGKTEIYLSLTSHYRKLGKQVLILVPEISLTTMMLSAFYHRFGKNIAILHSQLTPAEKYDEYRKIKEGKVDIVVGARSAIFAPLDNIGLIVIDEEHSETYKQDTAPFYHALIVAQMRAKSFNAKIVLGSATPSIETMARAKKGVYGYYSLTERINKNPLPNTTVINMSDRRNISPKTPYISRTLTTKIREALDAKTQVILLVNRRGYATYVSCRHCGLAKRCPTCNITLTFHKTTNVLQCHHCGLSFEVNAPCEKCGNNNFSYTGFATQKAEENIQSLFPDARVLRLDSDIGKNDGSSQKILDKFMNHQADILIGTQMIAKGHDFPLVSLVGVISTDALLAFPSFRSSERVFQLITQAIGRSGRDKVSGQAVIQTMLPDNYVINYAQAQDYGAFYENEMRQRYLTKNPPFYYLLSITISHQNRDIIDETMRSLKYNLSVALQENAIVIGPSPVFYPQHGKAFSETIIVKYKNYFKIKPILIKTLQPFREKSSLYVEINVDPYDV